MRGDISSSVSRKPGHSRKRSAVQARRARRTPAALGDVNAIVADLLRDLASAQASRPAMFGYKRAAAAIFSLEAPLTELATANGTLPKIPGVGPASSRVIREVLETGASPIVERAVDASGRRDEIEQRRSLRAHFLSRAAVVRALRDPMLGGPSLADYLGDLQMHSEWSDGSSTLEEIGRACERRGYRYAAVTDHSHGLKIAGGMSMQEAAEQRRAIKRVNARTRSFRLLQGIEANIGADGQLDLSDREARQFEIVLAAPHSRLRRSDDQTRRLITAIDHPSVRILAHPRGRITGMRGGVVADWRRVFSAAARAGVAVEIDGDPARQDLDYTLAVVALKAGCLFALDSDAHTTGQLTYAETAIAHARLARIPVDRIVNCWSLERLLGWLAEPRREARPDGRRTRRLRHA